MEIVTLEPSQANSIVFVVFSSCMHVQDGERKIDQLYPHSKYYTYKLDALKIAI